jgi:hypothetical protein
MQEMSFHLFIEIAFVFNTLFLPRMGNRCFVVTVTFSKKIWKTWPSLEVSFDNSSLTPYTLSEKYEPLPSVPIAQNVSCHIYQASGHSELDLPNG